MSDSKVVWVLVGYYLDGSIPLVHSRTYKTNMSAWMAGKKLLKKMYPGVPFYDEYKDSEIRKNEVKSNSEYLEFDSLSHLMQGNKTFQFLISPVEVP